jgi:GNAT superfamily N-acetyltransferase
MIRAASREDLSILRDLLGRSNHAPYDIVRVVEEKCFGSGFSGASQCRVFIDGEQIAGVSVVCGKFLRILAVEPAKRRRGIGSSLLRDAEGLGASVVAAEPGNYFTPGVFDEDSTTIGFLHRRGYAETASTHNLEADLSAAQAAVGPLRTTPEVMGGVLGFIEREFGRIWRFEASRGTLLHVVVDGEIAGFSAYEANNRGLGSFGPTGVARSMRNRGLGRQLLHASLAGLRGLGYARVIIPWTDALDFYRKSCGATPAARFLTMSKSVVSRP